MKDMTGRHFGRLHVVSFAGLSRHRAAKWLCMCDCGKELVVVGYSLRTGHTQSCGCLMREVNGQRFAAMNRANKEAA
jgi:hypothetical protein